MLQNTTRTRAPFSKCTLCNDRLGDGKDPACSSLCPTGALQFADLDAGNGIETVPGFPATDLDPRANSFQSDPQNGPAMSQESMDGADSRSPSRPGYLPEVCASIESEWSLIAFTLAATLLVAIVGAAAIGTLSIGGIDFLIGALAAMGIEPCIWARSRGPGARSSICAVRGSVAKSWLIPLSWLLALATFFSPSPGGILTAAAVSPGSLHCIVIDRVYKLDLASRIPQVSQAAPWLTGLYLCGIIASVARLRLAPV